MSKKLSKEKIEAMFDSITERATQLVEHEEYMDAFWDRVERKYTFANVNGGMPANLPALVALVYAYKQKEYLAIPKDSLIRAVTALVYFVTSEDIIPDDVPVLGLTDDAMVVDQVVEEIGEDLDKFNAWLEAKEANELECSVAELIGTEAVTEIKNYSFEDGYAQGCRETTLKNATNLKNAGMPAELISSCLGLEIDEIRNL